MPPPLRRQDTLTAKQNVRVYCRVRPPTSKREEEDMAAHGMALAVEKGENRILMHRHLMRGGVDLGDGRGGPSGGGASDAAASLAEESTFTFDGVFPQQSRQEEVFKVTAAPLVQEIFAGFNCTIFAYGQTGSGKTHTMMGALGTPHRGIVPRLVEQIFLGIEQADINVEFTLKVSFVEIYMEHIRDLLNPRQTNLHIRETREGEVYLQGVTEIWVNAFEQILDVLDKGNSSRAIATTRMNEASSRSHSVFSLTLGQRHKETGSVKSSKLYLVDLAGSEKVSKSEAAGHTLDEAKFINKSLSSLGNVIYSLTEGSAHVPYRDSKLTRLLNDSLGGNSKTSLIITASPSLYNADETLSTLRFGARAKLIKNKPKVNQQKSIAEYQAMLRQAAKQIKQQAELIKSLEGDTLQLKAAVLRLSPDYDPNDPKVKEREAEIFARLGKVGGGSSAAMGSMQLKLDEAELEKAHLEEDLLEAREVIAEKESDLELQAELLAERQGELARVKTESALAKETAERFEEKVQEYAVFRKKVELMEQEYVLQLDELEMENADLTEKLHALLLNEIESRHAQALRARKRKDARPKRQSLQQAGGSGAAGSGGPVTPRLVDEAGEDARAGVTPDQAELRNTPRGGGARRGASPREPAAAPGASSKEVEKLRRELARTRNDYLAASSALEELRGRVGADSVDTAVSVAELTRVNATLDEQVAKLRRQVGTQERLLQNRQQHVDVLELALQEANSIHKKMDAERKAEIVDLREKLAAAERIFDELYAADSGVRETRAGSSHMVVPMQGGHGSRHTTPANSAR